MQIHSEYRARLKEQGQDKILLCTYNNKTRIGLARLVLVFPLHYVRILWRKVETLIISVQESRVFLEENKVFKHLARFSDKNATVLISSGAN